MNFEDLTVFDIYLIRSNAIKRLISTQSKSNRFEALIYELFVCIEAKGFNILPRPEISTLVEKFSKKPFQSIEPDPTPEQILVKVFTHFRDNGIELIRDPERIATWSQIKNTVEVKQKKPWVI